MRKSLKFYDALPKHKAELVDGKMIIEGIKVEHAKLYDSAEEFGIQLVEIFEVNIPNATTERLKFGNLGGMLAGVICHRCKRDGHN